MPAASTTNRLGALERIHDLLLKDAVAMARRFNEPSVPSTWSAMPDRRGVDRPGIEQLLQRHFADPDHPRNWHRRALQDALHQPRVRDIYFRVKRSLWTWPEFTSLLPNARRILDAAVELAREEAFPWFLNVQADEILRLVCIDRKTFFDRLHDLECFTIARPARRMSIVSVDKIQSCLGRAGYRETWPSRANNWCVDESSPLEELPQWVIRYRRGIPFNKRRAAWWINYDLLCNTQRVLPCFEACLDTLPRNYFDRNRRSGTRIGFDSDAGFKALERKLAKDGPLPPLGLRAALWTGM
jgi:hypothetical protein